MSSPAQRRDDPSRVWSPQLRKWAKDARQHGMPISFTTVKRAGVGAGGFADRITDDFALRITDDSHVTGVGPSRVVGDPIFHRLVDSITTIGPPPPPVVITPARSSYLRSPTINIIGFGR